MYTHTHTHFILVKKTSQKPISFVRLILTCRVNNLWFGVKEIRYPKNTLEDYIPMKQEILQLNMMYPGNFLKKMSADGARTFKCIGLDW